MKRIVGCSDDVGCVFISALRAQTLLPMLEQIVQMLSQNLTSAFSTEPRPVGV